MANLHITQELEMLRIFAMSIVERIDGLLSGNKVSGPTLPLMPPTALHAVEDTPVAAKLSDTHNGKGISLRGVTYHVTSGFDKKLVAKQAPSSSKAFAAVLKAGKAGIRATDVADITGLKIKTVESSLYGLRKAGLVESKVID